MAAFPKYAGRQVRMRGLTLAIQPAHHVVAVVGEEALVVQGVAEHLSHGCAAHGLLMTVLVHHMPKLQQLLQPAAIGLEVGGGDDAVL